ncbi:MAG: hypothetical protein JW720_06070 [Sedimentisphaerales bacterium]|nr:hypothetical protein [Sedimentisphaerales bacterium]
MKVTKIRGVAIGLSIASGLLLVLAASCSLQKKHETEQAEYKPKPFVANPFCYACHADFEGEKLVTQHEKAAIGCERCHGESERHRSDEANIAPPEIMYPREKINPTCMMCHPRDAIKHVGAHEVILAGADTVVDESEPDGADKVCTDCHAKQHKMSVRIVRWNKATGDIIRN